MVEKAKRINKDVVEIRGERYIKNPWLHLIIYKCMKQKSSIRFVNHDVVREILHRRLHKIPHPGHTATLKEMEALLLIKRNGNSRNIYYELTGGDKDKLINQDIDVV